MAKKLTKKVEVTEDMIDREEYAGDLLKPFEYKGEVHTDFVIEEIGGEAEEAISKKEIKVNGGKVIRTLLACCVIRIGTLERDNLKKDEWIKIIQELDTGNQDYIMLRLRELSKGTEIELKEHKCANSDCKAKIDTVIDTDELEIIPYNGIDIIEFELPRGFVDKEGNYHKTGKMRRPVGLDREVLDPLARTNIGKANTMMLYRCIVEVEGMKITESDVRNLKNRDRQELFDMLRDNMFGVDFNVEITCPVCGETFTGNLSASNFI